MKRLALSLSLFLTAVLHAGPALVVSGKSDYRIVRPDKASPSQVYAAEELQSFLAQMTGAKLPILTDAAPLPAKAILLGNTKYTAKLLGAPVDFKKLGDDGFHIKTCDPHVVVAGNDVRGTLYGVYELLEHYGGCRWYASFYSVIPKKENWTLPEIDDIQTPAFIMREPFWYDMFEGDFAARSRANGNRPAVTEKHGGKIRFGGGLFVHTFYRLMSPDEFFADHPEYFSEINGKRVADHAQLCLSNPDVIRICTERLLERIRKDPDAKLYSLSQNDWRNPCTCEKCRAVDEREGSHAGMLIQFVNQVAAEVEKEFPDVWIETLAYQYTRTPPKTLKPRHNVVPRLCTIECDFSNPLDRSAYESNAKFMEEIKGWDAITDKLYIWDYTTNFGHYVGPHPNFASLQGNVKIFRDHGVVGLFEQGAYQGRHAEFAELRAWILAKLLWNPDQDIEALYSDFFNGYYGAAAPLVREYWRELQSFTAPEDTYLRIWFSPIAKYYPEGFFKRSLELWKRAEAAVKDNPQLSYNVRMSALPVYYSLLHKIDNKGERFVYEDGTYKPQETNAEFAALATVFLKRFDEAKNIRIAENMDRHRQFISKLRSATEGVPTISFQGAGFEANLVNEFGGRICSLSQAGGPNLLDPEFGIDATQAATDYTRPATAQYTGAKAGDNAVTTTRTLRRYYKINRKASLDAKGLSLQTSFTSLRTAPIDLKPVIRAGFNLGNASAACFRLGDNPWQTTVVAADQIFQYGTLKNAQPGQTLTVASPVTGRAVSITLPKQPIERISVLCDVRAQSIRLFVFPSHLELAGKKSYSCQATFLPIAPPTDLPSVKVATRHEASRFIIPSFQIGIGRRGTWGDHVNDPLSTDGQALKLYNTHYEWCSQWRVKPKWFDAETKYKVRMRIRIEKIPGAPDGEAFWAGVYDSGRKRGYGQANPKASEVKPGYQWYDVATWVPEDRQYVWIGPGRFDKEALSANPAIKAVYIDKFEFIRQEK